MALYADGPTRINGIASWRVKETDRIAAMAAELRKLGATVTEGPDFIEVAPPAAWAAATIRTYDDHRMAMCLSLAAFNPLATPAAGRVPLRILDPQCVAKTFPDYFEALTYKNLLLRSQALVEKDPGKQQALLKQADQLRDKAQELQKQKQAQPAAAAGRGGAKS